MMKRSSILVFMTIFYVLGCLLAQLNVLRVSLSTESESNRRASARDGIFFQWAPILSSPVGINSLKGLQPDNLLVQQGDKVYLRRDWDGSPVVMEDYKLLFFTTAKVGCTIWKQLFRRMMGIVGWERVNTKGLLPWNPELNGLKYLYDFNRTYASHMMTSPEWTRAIFVRDPKERFLSAYLDKVVQNPFFTTRACCPSRPVCASSSTTLEEFFELAQTCDNPHWSPQHRRMEPKYWSYINFVGNMRTVAEDAERLLRQIGAWEAYGASGWGPFGNHSIFQSEQGTTGSEHATRASERLRAYYTAELETKVDLYSIGDYMEPKLGLERSLIHQQESSIIKKESTM